MSTERELIDKWVKRNRKKALLQAVRFAVGAGRGSGLQSVKTDKGDDMQSAIVGNGDAEGGGGGSDDDDKANDDEKRLPDGWIREDSRSKPGKFVYIHSESGTRCGKRPTLSTERGLIDKWVKKRRESGRAEVDESDDSVSRASDLLSFKSDGDMGPTIAGIDDVEGGVAEASDDKKRLSDGWIRKDSRKKLGNFVYAHSESGTRSGKRPTLSTERGLIEMWMKKRRKSDRGEADESGEGFTAPSVPAAAEVHADRASLQQSMLEKAIQAIDNGRGRFLSNMVAGDSDSDSMGGYSEDPSVASEGADADQARQDAMLDNDSDSSSEAYSLEIAE